MTASAHDVAASIRRRLPGVGNVKLHKLMYFAQGHHLAWFSVSLFEERIEAWEHGPVVADVWQDEHHDNPPESFNELDNGRLNTIGYVLSRYGHNTGHDLETLTHNEGPWREAYHRATGGRDRHTIGIDAMRTFFLDVHATDNDEDEIQFDPADIARFLVGAGKREMLPSKPDTRESLLARLRA